MFLASIQSLWLASLVAYYLVVRYSETSRQWFWVSVGVSTLMGTSIVLDLLHSAYHRKRLQEHMTRLAEEATYETV